MKYLLIALTLFSSGCAFAKINTDTERAYIIGFGSYKNEKGAEICTFQMPEMAISK